LTYNRNQFTVIPTQHGKKLFEKYFKDNNYIVNVQKYMDFNEDDSARKLENKDFPSPVKYKGFFDSDDELDKVDAAKSPREMAVDPLQEALKEAAKKKNRVIRSKSLARGWTAVSDFIFEMDKQTNRYAMGLFEKMKTDKTKKKGFKGKNKEEKKEDQKPFGDLTVKKLHTLRAGPKKQ
jgi:hypothetical protein